jgi:ribosomal protein S18 acetylase RimI-like enzyme
LGDITLRPYVEADIPFLYLVYASSRADEMAQLWQWSDSQKAAFLQFQFNAQHTHYHEHYPDAHYSVVLLGCVEIGRFYVAPMRNEIRLMDIALLPEYRGRGIGGGLVRELLVDATASDRFVSLHVEELNPARRLYQRLGFVDVDDVGVYKLMHWVPDGLTPVYKVPS